jgi:predicted nucleotidyltransferase
MTIKELMPFPKTELQRLYALTELFYNGSQETSDYIQVELKEISKRLQSILGANFQMSLGVGYPFYAIDEKGEVKNVTEIKRYMKSANGHLAQMDDAHWPCNVCQKVNNLPNLKSVCGTCSKTVVKPRDIFKMMPDLDIFIIVEKNDDNIENAVFGDLKAFGYSPSDIDIETSVKDATEVLSSVNFGKKTEKKLPIDVHLITLKQLIKLRDKVITGNFTIKDEVESRSLRMGWEDYNLPLLFDLIFSATEILNKDEHSKASLLIKQIRSSLKDQMGEDGLIKMIIAGSERAANILKDEELLSILKDRIAKW